MSSVKQLKASVEDLEVRLSDIAKKVALLAKDKDDDGSQQDGGTIEPAESEEGEPPRITVEGTCDGKVTVISQTNGQSDTLMYPKNVGTCGNVVIYCRDSLGRKHTTSEVVLGAGKSLRRYDTIRNTHSIVFYCDGDGGECILEFDR